VKQTFFFRAWADKFYGYIKSNQHLIPNYSDRYRYGEIISTSFVESTVNEVISKRMVKKQQMRWTKKGAHRMIQVRIATQNNELRESFCSGYPSMKENNEESKQYFDKAIYLVPSWEETANTYIEKINNR